MEIKGNRGLLDLLHAPCNIDIGKVEFIRILFTIIKTLKV
jgi:hypothetical protein